MDISDGFAGDLAKMLRLAGLTAEVETACVPLSDAARKILQHAPSLLETIFTGGDDYEIFCAVPPSQSAAFEAEAPAAGIRCRRLPRPCKEMRRQFSRMRRAGVWSSRGLPSGIFSGVAVTTGFTLLARMQLSSCWNLALSLVSDGRRSATNRSAANYIF